MNNFSVFNKEELMQAIDPFLPGAVPHITPISFHTWTPDIFLFLFRTTDHEGRDHFFVVCSYDHLTNGRQSMEKIIESWYKLKVLEYIDPIEDDSIELDHDGGVKLDGVYYAHLARVERPVSLEYWSDCIVVKTENDIDKLLVGYTEKERESVRAFLQKNSQYTATIYKNVDGEMEFFYA